MKFPGFLFSTGKSYSSVQNGLGRRRKGKKTRLHKIEISKITCSSCKVWLFAFFLHCSHDSNIAYYDSTGSLYKYSLEDWAIKQVYYQYPPLIVEMESVQNQDKGNKKYGSGIGADYASILWSPMCRYTLLIAIKSWVIGIERFLNTWIHVAIILHLIVSTSVHSVTRALSVMAQEHRPKSIYNYLPSADKSKTPKKHERQIHELVKCESVGIF